MNIFKYFHHSFTDCLIGVTVKVSASRPEDLWVEFHLYWDFSGSSHSSDFKISTAVATLPGTWRYKVSAGTGGPDVSIA